MGFSHKRKKNSKRMLRNGIGRILGKMAGDVAAMTQSVGQKNTILAVWLALNFLDPIASVAPTAYIVWQNLLNSWQIFRHNQRLAKKEAE